MAIGPTGEFPRGKLQESDEGALRIAIGVKDRTIIINFGTSVSWVGLDPDTALQMADSLSKHAHELKGLTQ